MYRASRQLRAESPMRGLFGMNGAAISGVYSVYMLPQYTCATNEARAKAALDCAAATRREDSFNTRYGRHSYRVGTSLHPYQVLTSDVTSSGSSTFSPCQVATMSACARPVPGMTVTPVVAVVATPVELREVVPSPPQRGDTPQPVQVTTSAADEPQAVFAEEVPVAAETAVIAAEAPEAVEVPEEEAPEEDNKNLYIVGGIALLVAGGGLAYYLTTRGKKRR